jgi:hypothetical protein
MHARADSARRLAEEGDPARIPAEPGDIRLDPLERGALILKAIGACRGVRGVLRFKLGEREVSEGT